MRHEQKKKLNPKAQSLVFDGLTSTERTNSSPNSREAYTNLLRCGQLKCLRDNEKDKDDRDNGKPLIYSSQP